MSNQPKSPYPKEVYNRNAEIYKTLANSKRLEILNILKENELTVNEIAKELGVRVANVSQHLYVLKTTRLVKSRRDGQRLYYTLTHPDIVASCKIFNDLYESNELKNYLSEN